MNKLESAQEYVQQQVKSSAARALRISEKISNGEYATEHAPCFCGADDDEVVDKQDRYGIPMQTVLCKSCALIRVNPRLTKEAFEKFYNSDYRILNFPQYFTCDISSLEEQQTALYERQLVKGDELLKLLVQQAIDPPKVVVDYGCHLGGMLVPFQKHYGSEVWGVEWDEEAAAFLRAQGVKVVRSIDELIAVGVKADLVVMQDVIEHFTDLNEVRQVQDIMAQGAFLYVYTPGLFRANFHTNKQIAHTYYFCANTLFWVMDTLGFAPTYLDEDSTSFWQKGPQHALPARKPVEWVEYERDELKGKVLRKMPPFHGVCKFTKEELYGNMSAVFDRHLPDLYELTNTETGGVALINGGPSINDQIETIRDLQKQGVKIMSILRMYPWCVDNGIIPDYVVSLDCMEDQIHGFDKLVPGVKYLFASVTRPSFVDLVQGEKIYIFDSRDDAKIKDLRRAAGYTTCSVVNGGGSVSVCCVSLVFNLGFRDLHIFGLDLMCSDVKNSHAAGIAGTSLEIHPLPITIDGKDILTTGAWLEFANQTLDLLSVAHAEQCLHSVKVYGESLINYLWDGKFIKEAA